MNGQMVVLADPGVNKGVKYDPDYQKLELE